MSPTLAIAFALASLALPPRARAASDAVVGDGAPLAPLMTGVSVEAVLPATPGAVIAHPLRGAVAGLVTLRLESYDFDARLCVKRADDRLLGEATGGGAGLDAVLCVPLEAGADYRVVVGSEDGRGGEYRLELLLGESAPPTGAEWTRAEIRYWETVGERARRRGDTKRTVTALRLSGQHANALGWFTYALERFREALGIAEATSGFEPEARFARLLLGSILLDLGEYDEAFAYLSATLDALEREDDPALRVFVLSRLGELSDARHELDQAEAFYGALHELARARRLPAVEARALGLLGLASSGRGRREAAFALHRASLDVASALGPEDRGFAHFCFGQSLVRLDERDLARAELACAADLAAGEVQVSALQTLGALERQQGHYWPAVERLEDARQRCEALGHEVLLPATLCELASLARSFADDEHCEALLQRALELTRDPWLARPRIQVLRELALLREEQHDAAQRRALLETAVELARTEGYREEEARSRLALGACLQDAGELDAARTLYAAALRTAQDSGARTLASIAEANLASVDLFQGRTAEAEERGERAWRALSSGGLRFEALYALETVARAALARNDTERAAALVDLARETLIELGDALDPERESGLRSREAWWAAPLDQDLSQLQVASARSARERADALREGFRRAGEWKGRALHAGLAARRAPGLGAGESEEVLPDLARALDPTTMLIEYVGGSERLLAYTLYRGELERIDLGPRAELESRAGAFARELGAPSPATSPADLFRVGHRLYADLLAPPLARAPEARKLAIVPTTALAALPFEALPVELLDPGDGVATWDDLDYVLDRFVVAYAPSSPILAYLARRNGAAPEARERRVLILADPDYERGPAPRGRSLAFEQLPGTRAEATFLAGLLGGSQAEATVGSARDVLFETPELTLCLGSEATPARLCAALDYTIIHCAAHGVVDVRDPRQTGIALSFSAETSGFLSVTDVLGVELGAELVVLSACDTARGRERRGEGIQSMAYAFVGAGARSVVANLWKVDDEASAALMLLFYESLWRDGRTPAEALATAKRSSRKESPVALVARSRGVPLVAPAQDSPLRGHPCAWAAHVFVGLP